MTATPNFEIVGLKDALKILNDTDKTLRRQITKDFKELMAPVIADAKQLVPERPPLSGMKRTWKTKSGVTILPWQYKSATRTITAFTSGKKVRDTGLGFRQNLAVFGMKWTGPEAALFDMAGKAKPGSPMANKLTERYGSPSRAMWRAYEQKADDVHDKVKDLVWRVMQEANRMIGNI
ncbi:MAG: hypothetical protein EBT13_15485 [Rhodobacteraceae bacterium]|nr:hypothetical protein [Paracoccaceae bacterium]